ncbi:MAG: hypothetical protein RIK87_28450, partial [Fuerstiella sp.]
CGRVGRPGHNNGFAPATTTGSPRPQHGFAPATTTVRLGHNTGLVVGRSTTVVGRSPDRPTVALLQEPVRQILA